MGSSNNLPLQMSYLSSINSKIIKESVSESILDSLECLEMIYEFENIPIRESMVDAYCAVSLHCTFQCLPGNSPDSILARRISKLEILNSQFLTDDLRDYEERIQVLRSNPDDLHKWKKINDTKYKEQALILTTLFLREAMSFIEAAKKQAKEEENGISAASQRETTEEAARAAEASENKVEESKGKETNMEEGKDNDMDDSIGDCKYPEVVGAKRKETQGMFPHKPASQRRRYRGPAKIVCSDDVDSDNEIRPGTVEANTEVEFLDREAEARKNRDESKCKAKETNMEGNKEDCIVGGGEFTFSEIFTAKGKEIHGDMLLHKPAPQQRRYKGPARIIYSDDLDSEIVSSDMCTSLNQASTKAAVINTPSDNPKSSHVKQAAVSNPPLDSSKNSVVKQAAVSNPPVDSSKSSDVKQAAVNNPPVDSSKRSDVKQAAVNNPLTDELLKVSLDSPKRRVVSPLNLYVDKKFTKRRQQNKWMPEEVDALRQGVRKYGAGNWKLILNSNRNIFSKRLDVDLKDKWRNMTKAAYR